MSHHVWTYSENNIQVVPFWQTHRVAKISQSAHKQSTINCYFYFLFFLSSRWILFSLMDKKWIQYRLWKKPFQWLKTHELLYIGLERKTNFLWEQHVPTRTQLIITQTIAIGVRTNFDWSQLLSLQDFYVKNLWSKATRELDHFLWSVSLHHVVSFIFCICLISFDIICFSTCFDLSTWLTLK